MRKGTLFASMIVAVSASGGGSEAQAFDYAKLCDLRVPGTSAFYSSDGRIRVDQTSICLDEDSRTAVFLGEAAAMNKQSYVGASQAPWLNLILTDDEGKDIWAAGQTLGTADIPECGGYAAIVRRIPYEAARATYTFRLEMGGAGSDACSPSQRTMLLRALSKAVTIAEEGGTCPDCTEDEQTLLSAARAMVSQQ
jgi:hypothetical protein